MIAKYAGVEVRFELPSELEKAGYSKATKAVMNSDKLKKLGWKARWNIYEGIKETLEKLEQQ